MPPNKGIFGRKGLKPDPNQEGETEGNGLLGEIAAGFYGGDPALNYPPLLALPAGDPTGNDDAFDDYQDDAYTGFAATDQESFAPVPTARATFLPQPLPELLGSDEEDPFEDDLEELEPTAAANDGEDALDIVIPVKPRLKSESITDEPVNITLEMQFEAVPEPVAAAVAPASFEAALAVSVPEPSPIEEIEPQPLAMETDKTEPPSTRPVSSAAPLPNRNEETPMKSDRSPLGGEHIERLRRGLELVITEDQLMSLSGRAIGQLVPQLSTELLLTTDGRSLSPVLATGPNGEGPGCTVNDTTACPAMRLNRMLVFENSEFLDACPYLVIRRGEPCGAVCIPFTMPDDVGGVLHATSPATKPIDERTIDDIAVTMTMISRRSFEIRSGEQLDQGQVELEVNRLLGERTREESFVAADPAPVETATYSTQAYATEISLPESDTTESATPDSYASESFATESPVTDNYASLAADSGAASWGSDAGYGVGEAELASSGPEVIEGIVDELVAEGATLALGLVHLDKFRIYNRTHGIDAGDAAVQRFREVAEVVIRHGDVLANDGGDEFFLVFPETTAKEAAAICDRIRTELAGSFADGALPVFTASIGIADTEDGTTFDELLEAVERAVVSAEAAGRDLVMTSRSSGAGRLSRAKN